MSRDIFQQKMDMIQGKCSGTFGLIEDVIVYGKTKEGHVRNLHNLMKIAQIEGLGFKRIYFFGAIYDKNGIRPDPQKLVEIKMLPIPKTITNLLLYIDLRPGQAVKIGNTPL